jgi:hypothetical protein
MIDAARPPARLNVAAIEADYFVSKGGFGRWLWMPRRWRRLNDGEDGYVALYYTSPFGPLTALNHPACRRAANVAREPPGDAHMPA